jgi:polyisoprenoid-binding protein YceI
VSATGDAIIPTTGTGRIDSVHSTAHFSVGHNAVATFRAGFRDITGALQDGVLTGSVQVDGIVLPGPDVFKDHLMAPEWFDGANHAAIDFRSTDLHTHGSSVHGAGELTIKGVTRPVELKGRFSGPAEVGQGDQASERIGLDLTATIDRQEFGITGLGGADWQVTLEVSLELVRS